MAYEMFERSSVRSAEPAISIASATIVFNAAAWRILATLRAKHVLIFWDEDNRRIALKPLAKTDKNSFAISGGDHSASFRAKSFLQHIGWSASKRQLIPTTWDERQRVFEATLPSQYLATRRDQVKSRG